MKKPPEHPIDKCRNCKHFDYMHLNEYGGNILCSEIIETIIKNGQILITERCYCHSYSPLDNLKYLEQLHGQKEYDTNKRKRLKYAR